MRTAFDLMRDTLYLFDQRNEKPICWSLNKPAIKTLAGLLHAEFKEPCEHPHLLGVPIRINDSDDPNTLWLLYENYGVNGFYWDLRDWECPSDTPFRPAPKMPQIP